MEYRGVDFMVERFSQALQPVLDLDGCWYIYGNKVDIKSGKEQLFADGEVVTGEEFRTRIEQAEKKGRLMCVAGTFGAFNAPEQAAKAYNYHQFLKSGCRVAVNVADNWIVRVYCKDQQMLQRYWDYAKTQDPDAYLLTEEDDLGIGN